MIRGQLVDSCGRCEHYASELDIVANLCLTCGEYWACYRCHESAGHQFGRVPRTSGLLAVQCGMCGHSMTYEAYSAGSCASCGAGFNPGCALHADIYFS
ncbi:CHY zinc finger protein [Corynebacterium epidermidicanis]|uniref:CHY-type domain-containing protein n=1 Tax=Corynebacterium epidermidicanis TaxID=1050174 RepID=A0A0G3GT75_9CORY|nr:CHY zinc finger protein [Corynebacterium epidermidicanis]AKK02062.1 hypothetical protein CEPID_00840 [Corynebacterium epidermidicanis]